MTVSTFSNIKQHTGDGQQTVFDYDFRLDNASDMEVFVDEVQQSGNYTVVTGQTGGTVTFTSGTPGAGTLVTLRRILPVDQQIAYRANDPFPSATHEFGLDKLTMLAQQQQEILDRTLQYTFLSGSNPDPFALAFGSAVERAGQLWRFDESGLLVISVPVADDQAYRWAETPEDQVVENIGGIDRYSAFHWAQKAEKIASVPVTTKGDLFGYSTAPDRLPIGTNGQLLTPDDSAALGLKWVDPPPQVLPPTTVQNALNYLRVNAAGDNYELSPDFTFLHSGAGAWAEDDESIGGITSAEKTNYEKMITMKYVVGPDVMAWMSGASLLQLTAHKTLPYSLGLAGAMETAQAQPANVRLRVDVYKYGPGVDVTKTTPDHTATVEVAPPTTNTASFEINFNALIPAVPGWEDNPFLAISVSRIAASANEHAGALHLYGGTLNIGDVVLSGGLFNHGA